MRYCFIVITIVFMFVSLFSQESLFTFSQVLQDIDAWKNKQIVMKLRLKQVDYLFEKIIFYDSDNITIEFSFSDNKKQKELADDLLNAHEGVLYNVRFVIVGQGNLGGLMGDLQEFTPVFSDLIPESR